MVPETGALTVTSILEGTRRFKPTNGLNVAEDAPCPFQ